MNKGENNKKRIEEKNARTFSLKGLMKNSGKNANMVFRNEREEKKPRENEGF